MATITGNNSKPKTTSGSTISFYTKVVYEWHETALSCQISGTVYLVSSGKPTAKGSIKDNQGHSVTFSAVTPSSSDATTKIGTFGPWTYPKAHSSFPVSITAKLGPTATATDYSDAISTAQTSIAVAPKTSYAVTYNANGGSGAPSSQTKWYGETLELRTGTPTRTNYVFRYWTTTSGGSGTTYAPGGSYTENAKATLYAQWYAPYTVSYNANGGSGAPSSQVKVHNKSLTLSTTRPTRSGYRFLGWATSASATSPNASYDPGDTYTANQALSLYAVWRKNPTVGTVTLTRKDASGANDQMGAYVQATATWTAYSGSKVVFACNGVTSQVTVSGTSGTATSALMAVSAKADTALSLTATAYDAENYTASKSASNSTAYAKPSIAKVTSVRTDSGGNPADEGTWGLVTVWWKVSALGSQESPSFASVSVTTKGGAVISNETVTGLSGSTGSVSFTIGDTTQEAGPLSFNDSYNVVATVGDSLYDGSTAARPAATMKDVITAAFVTMDFLGDAYRYTKTTDTAVDSGKVYYQQVDGSWEVVEEPDSGSIGGYYEATGPRPGHGVSFGMPSSREGMTVAMPFAQGDGTIASSEAQTVLGRYNVEDTGGQYALIVGNGTGDADRSNALAVKWDGDIVTPGGSITPVVLYDDDTTALNVPITLSETAANFRRLTICYKTNDDEYSSVEVWHPDGKLVSLTATRTAGNSTASTVWLKSKTVLISGTTINTAYSTSSGTNYYFTSQTRADGNYATVHGDYIAITQVIGYR